MLTWAASIGTLDPPRPSEKLDSVGLHVLFLKAFYRCRFTSAEVPNPTYALGSNKEYSKNIYKPASPCVKRKQDLLTPILWRSLRATPSSFRVNRIPLKALPQIDMTSMAQQYKSQSGRGFDCAKATKLDVFKYMCTLQCVSVSGFRSVTTILLTSPSKFYSADVTVSVHPTRPMKAQMTSQLLISLSSPATLSLQGQR